MELIFAIYNSLHEAISGAVNHPRFGNSKKFRFFAPSIIIGLISINGAIITVYIGATDQIKKLEKEILELRIQQLAPKKETSDKDVKIAELQTFLTAQKDRIADLEKQIADLKTENASLRERVFNKEPVKQVPVEKPKNSDSILESSNRRLKRLGDKKDDPVQ